MSRSYARECAFKLIFEYLFSKEKNTALLEEYLAEDKNKDEVGYISEVYNGVINEFDNLMESIKKYSESFKIDRIFKVDLALLLVAIYEIEHKIVPAKVGINEALNLAKTYSTDKSATYINGVLKNFVGE